MYRQDKSIRHTTVHFTADINYIEVHMEKGLKSYIKDQFGICDDIMNMADSAERDIEETVKKINSIREYNQYKVIKAMQNNGLSDTHFAGTTGYGYDDRG